MSTHNDLLQSLAHLSAPQLRRLLTEHLTKQKLGLYWESSAIERDAALPRLNADADLEAAWNKVADDREADIAAGCAHWIPGEQALQSLRARLMR